MVELPLAVWHVYFAVLIIPFSMYSWYVSHSSSNHVARGHTCLSSAVRCGCSISSSGLCSPILAFISPHTTVTNWGCTLSSVDSTAVVAMFSGMFLLVSDVVGGM